MRLEFSPPYSPYFNPIEETFSSIKVWIRRNRDSVRGEMTGEPHDAHMVLWDAVHSVTAEKAHGWFMHAGYLPVPNEVLA